MVDFEVSEARARSPLDALMKDAKALMPNYDNPESDRMWRIGCR